MVEDLLACTACSHSYTLLIHPHTHTNIQSCAHAQCVPGDSVLRGADLLHPDACALCVHSHSVCVCDCVCVHSHGTVCQLASTCICAHTRRRLRVRDRALRAGVHAHTLTHSHTRTIMHAGSHRPVSVRALQPKATKKGQSSLMSPTTTTSASTCICAHARRRLRVRDRGLRADVHAHTLIHSHTHTIMHAGSHRPVSVRALQPKATKKGQSSLMSPTTTTSASTCICAHARRRLRVRDRGLGAHGRGLLRAREGVDQAGTCGSSITWAVGAGSWWPSGTHHGLPPAETTLILDLPTMVNCPANSCQNWLF